MHKDLDGEHSNYNVASLKSIAKELEVHNDELLEVKKILQDNIKDSEKVIKSEGNNDNLK